MLPDLSAALDCASPRIATFAGSRHRGAENKRGAPIKDNNPESPLDMQRKNPSNFLNYAQHRTKHR
jgi:hypothetical protein